jgi:EmrB/QacA subfamily drug resistance transporter
VKDGSLRSPVLLAARLFIPEEGRVVMLLREAARPAAVREHRMAPWFAVATVCFGAFMGQLDASIVTLAFPALQRQYGVGLAGVQWVSLSYLLALVALLVPVGRWSDRAGRKLVYLYGFVVFTAASAGCGLAWSLGVLIVLRVVQAAGAAMLQANSVALVATSAPPGQRRAALGIQAAAQALGLALGPVTGGLLLAASGWRWIFFVNVPVGALALVAGWFLLPRTRQRASRAGADPVGLILLAAAVTAGLLAVSAAAGLGMPSSAVAACGTLAVLAGTGLVRWERRAASPLVDLPLLTGGGLAAGLAGALCAYMVLFGPLVLFPQLMSAHGDGPLRTGLILASLPAGFGLAAVAAERVLPARWPNGRRCAAGGILAANCAAGLAIPASPAVTALLLGMLGLGLGLYMPANNAAIMATVPPGSAASAGGLVNMARGLGTALGVAAVSLTLHAGARPGPAMLTLAVLALAAAWTGRAARAGDHDTARGGGR